MVSRRQSTPEEPTSRRRPATTPEDRENQLIDAAINRAEQQIRDGTASAQVITHFLKLGSRREKLEQERLRQENILIAAKVKQLEMLEETKTLYENAIKAMRMYAGQEPLELDDYSEDNSVQDYET